MTFLDTSGLVAYFDARDAHHARARRAWKRILADPDRPILTSLIIVETVTLLRRRAGFVVAQRVGERLLSGAVAEIVHVDARLLLAAWAIFEKYRDHDLSLTDCASFAVMRQRGITRALTFDDDFRALGFEGL